MNHFQNIKISIEELKERISPFDFYSSEFGETRLKPKLKWTGAGLCPFHQDKQKGSFYVNLTSGAFRCFSCGAKGSDVIRFVQDKYQIDFKSALNKLRNDWGI